MAINARPWMALWVLILLVVMQAYPVWGDTAETGNQDTLAVSSQLDAFHKAAANADAATYFGLFSKDGVFIGTDASEHWTVEEFKQYAKPYFDQGKGWTYVPRDRTLVIHGDVAWFDELLDNAAYGECRGSGVLIKEDGQWKIAQYNLHFPIPNDLAKSITKMIKEHQAN
ncbi:nuclear transport factor 2 family protein [Microbulbifer sp. CAU 1566]|uniref:nuclear transport factor 2 family protein n=1 Tax=Microbulbifer sp. CAU 1566 TaxID=2933269 RepID=UPI0020059945|nr:nuclear transport factor 2 family protein [Microbulbifer sp. CAU 1566]MCK7596948.1 nuclear transport factor 2 family protein [Microbulbifer sp. CAU 1566]